MNNDYTEIEPEEPYINEEYREKILKIVPKEVFFEDMKKNMKFHQKILAGIDKLCFRKWHQAGLFFSLLMIALVTFVDTSHFNSKENLTFSMICLPGVFLIIPTVLHYLFDIKNKIAVKMYGNSVKDLKYLKKKEIDNEYYNNALNNKISLNIYKKIGPHFNEEEMKEILSYRLTYKDFGLLNWLTDENPDYIKTVNKMNENQEIADLMVEETLEKIRMEKALKVRHKRKMTEENLAKQLTSKEK